MEQLYKPIEIAKKLNISTNMLRYYEDKGLVPRPDRTNNRYRKYHQVHFIYFETVQAMSIGYSFEVISNIMSDIQNESIDDALWLLNNVHVQNRTDYELLCKLKEKAEEMNQHDEKLMRIGDLSKEFAVSTTAIRYWEKEGYIMSMRDADNPYRHYSESGYIKAGILKIVKSINYSSEIVELKDKLKLGDSVDEIKLIILHVERLLNKRNEEQLKGAHHLYRLINYLKHI
ncbi:MerR family DNA-binding transcriptional regulator [Oceanobacillus jeddahense]|uniref:MerR family DNA-binding transcriptional regulator n=1 Tax=Oceanobacillus jeddahense TaxID=1462527 RepID=UPI000595FD2D|nr:MerR family DNA-binding transcriptional regulator [Oceanobacillus jeddahense]